MRRFEVMFYQEGFEVDSGIIELDQAVIDAVDDNWRSNFYPLFTPVQIAEHIAINLIVNRWPLSQLDGWADQPDSNARVVKWPTLDDFAADAREITEPETQE